MAVEERRVAPHYSMFNNPPRKRQRGEDSSRRLIDYRKEIRGAVAQLARAPALQAGCRGFEPLRLQIRFGKGV